MISQARLLRPMWHLATLASIRGLLLGVMAVVSAGSMAVPIFTGKRLRDAMMLAFICVPAMQIVLLIVATIREDAHPRMALKLYAVTVILLVVLLAIPALPDLIHYGNFGWKADVSGRAI